MFNKRRLFVFLVDVTLVASAFVMSFLLRFDFRVPAAERDLLMSGLLVVVTVKPLLFIASGMYRNLWRYASLHDGIEIFKVVTASSAIFAFSLLYMRHFSPYPRSIFILDWILLFAMVAASRLVWRVYRETFIIPRSGKDRRTQNRTLIVGAGEAGCMLLKEIRRQENSAYNVVGFVDDDPDKLGMRLNGLPVLGDIRHLKAIVRKYGVEDVIFAIPSKRGRILRDVVECCEKSKVRFKTLPSITAIMDGKITMSQIKDVEIEDLLGREPVVLNKGEILSYLAGKKVLVTGAAGSIGSEICRQVARFGPLKLVLLDSAETPLYYIEKELTAQYPDLRIIPVMGDVRNSARVDNIFDEFTPDVVFHAAAYKHVPMMEYNPAEAVINNAGGTRIVADAAHRHEVKNFVMISTDKAVNPTNVMGATKRVAEIYVQALARRSRTKFTTVRFGNVLGSNGSVIPLFKEQIRNGGPVTVTDPHVIRYFMTIPEACQLVLQAGCIGNGGEIFVLDMGEPVKIADLAKELIRLSGLEPYQDIDIVFTGLRPGEKLFEELLIEGEGIRPTRHEKIKVLASVELNIGKVVAELDLLLRKASDSNLAGIMHSLRRLVPEFTPSYVFEGPAPLSFQRVRPDVFSVRRRPDADVVCHWLDNCKDEQEEAQPEVPAGDDLTGHAPGLRRITANS